MDYRMLADALSNFQKESVRATTEYWKGYWEFLGQITRDPGSFPAAYGRYSELSMKSYKTVLEASVALTERVFAKPAAAEAPAAAPGAAAEPAARRLRELVFEGAGDETPARQFVVANKTAQAIDVSFEVSEFAAETSPQVRAEVVLVPAAFSLQPGEETVVECRIPLVAVFAGGVEYRAILRAIGLPEMQIALVVKKAAA